MQKRVLGAAFCGHEVGGVYFLGLLARIPSVMRRMMADEADLRTVNDGMPRCGIWHCDHGGEPVRSTVVVRCEKQVFGLWNN